MQILWQRFMVYFKKRYTFGSFMFNIPGTPSTFGILFPELSNGGTISWLQIFSKMKIFNGHVHHKMANIFYCF